MKYRCRLTITAVCLAAAFFTASMPATSFAAEISPESMSESATETFQDGTEENETEAAETAGTDTDGTEMSEAEYSSEEETAGTAGEDWPAEPSIVAPSGILMEASTGTILYDKNMHEQHYPASITKIMTALLAIENCSMDEIVTVPHDAVYMEDKGSHIALDEGEELTVEDCLYAIMLASANDAAYALAVHVGGTIEDFADMMNKRAEELGCQDTHFTNPHGLPDENHVTSAYDMALITREALKYDLFRTIAGTTYYEIQPSEKQPDLIPMSHHHAMLFNGQYHYDGVFAGKNGYTVAAQNTLVTCAERNGMDLICVTMQTEGRQVYVDAATLFDYGFENFSKLDIGQNTGGNVTATVHAMVGETENSVPVTEEIPVQVAEDGYVVVPSTASFADLTPDLYYDAENAVEGETAVLEYRYGDRVVGQATIALPASLVTVQETQVPETEEAAPAPVEKRAPGAPVWLYPLLAAVAVVAAVGGIYLFVRRQIWKSRWRRRKQGKDSVYRRRVRRDSVYHIQARKRRWWK